jgi:hypothetical protein
VDVLREILGRSHLFAGKEVVFVNLALRGFKQPQQLMALNYFLTLGAEFDILINIDGFNEVAFHASQNGKHGVAAIYPRFWYLRVAGQTDESMLRMIAGIQLLREVRHAWAIFFSVGLPTYSPTANLAWSLGDRALERALYRQNAGLGEHAPESAEYVVTGPRRTYANEDEVYRDLVSIWRESSIQLERLSRANDIAYYHFLQPNQYVTGSKPLSREQRARVFDENHPYRRGVELGYPKLLEAGIELKRDGVRFNELTMIFEGVSDDIYIDPCCHFNQQGNEIMARQIASTILSETKSSR